MEPSKTKLITELKKTESNQHFFKVTLQYKIGMETKEESFVSNIYPSRDQARMEVDSFLERLGQTEDLSLFRGGWKS